MRYFSAITLSSPTDHDCLNLIDTLKHAQAFQNMRWTPKEKLHVTLQFIGEINADKLTQLMDRTKQAVQHTPPFSITWDTLERFPPKRHNTLVIRVSPNSSLHALAHTLRDLSLDLDLPTDKRPYLPHLTLGRHKGTLPLDAPRPAIAISPQTVDRITLYESRVTQYGSTYHPLSTIVF